MQRVVTDEAAPHPKNITGHFVYIDQLVRKGNLKFKSLEVRLGNKIGKTGSKVRDKSRKNSHNQKLNHFALCLIGSSGIECE